MLADVRNCLRACALPSMLLPGACSFYMDVVAVIIESTSAQMKCSSVGIGRSIGRGTRIVVEIGNAMRKGKGEGRDADTH